jgi:transcription elongation factor GreA
VKEAQKKLEEELRTLERELRVELPQEIKKALAMGDLRENAEYHAALERQSYVKARIGQLRARLTDLGMVNLSQVPRDRAGLGSSLTLLDLDADREITWELVVPEVADLERGLISIASPIGRGLVGKQPGDEVVIEIPAGRRRFEVLELRTMHEKG